MGISAENRNLMSKLMKSYKEIDKNMQNGICCWGAGSNGRWCLDYLLENNYKVDYFIDSSPALQNKKINNIPIISYEEYKAKNLNNVILITSKHYVLQIQEILKNYKQKMSFDSWFVIKNKKKYAEIFKLLSDEKSKKVLNTILKTMLTGNETYLRNIAENNQYFCLAPFFNTVNEVYVDLGAYTGDTIEKFIFSQNGSFKHIYGFEIGTAQISALNSRLERLRKEWAIENNKITIENAAASDTNGFMFIEDALQLFELHVTHKETKNKVKTFSLNDYFKNINTTFIKADIEGAERLVLKGAAEIVKRDRPKMALSVYHRPDDLFRIIGHIREWNIPYNYALRHHSPTLIETILYCWI